MDTPTNQTHQLVIIYLSWSLCGHESALFIVFLINIRIAFKCVAARDSNFVLDLLGHRLLSMPADNQSHWCFNWEVLLVQSFPKLEGEQISHVQGTYTTRQVIYGFRTLPLLWSYYSNGRLHKKGLHSQSTLTLESRRLNGSVIALEVDAFWLLKWEPTSQKMST